MRTKVFSESVQLSALAKYMAKAGDSDSSFALLPRAIEAKSLCKACADSLLVAQRKNSDEVIGTATLKRFSD
jgi:hypothetical protein